jgi:hypothetical protein
MKASFLIAGGLLALGCSGGGESARSGLEEPMRVQNGQFFPGALVPGEAGPNVSSLTDQNATIRPGESAWSFGGDAAKGALGVALRVRNLGNGYWVVPVGEEDPLAPGSYQWAAKIDWANDVPAGPHEMEVIAVAADGRFGPLTDQAVLPITIKPLVPDADVVLSLEWDTAADLDIHFTGPLELGGGKELDPKHPSTVFDADAGDTFPPGTGQLDRDSQAACVRDGFRREDVVWNSHEPQGPKYGLPLAGTYDIRVDMFDACGQGYANFKVTLFVEGVESFARTGRLLAIDADRGGPGSGLFVGQIQLGF